MQNATRSRFNDLLGKPHSTKPLVTAERRWKKKERGWIGGVPPEQIASLMQPRQWQRKEHGNSEANQKWPLAPEPEAEADVNPHTLHHKT